jgi:two-component system, chemotaxis family, chemotaxis protein CheY
MIKLDIHILLVDDTDCILELVSLFLEDYGFTNIKTAYNGKQALEIILDKDNVTDLIISDINMPTMNGIVFLKKLKENHSFNNIPFMYLTAEV